MGILDRLNLLIRSNTGSRLRESSDPKRELSSTFAELDSTLKDARRQTARVMRDEKRLERELLKYIEEEDRWEARAVLALEGGNEDQAREALVAKHRYVSRRREVEEDLTSLRRYLGDLMHGLEALEMKLEGVRARNTAREQASRQSSLPIPQPRRHNEAPPAPRHTPRSFESATDDSFQRWEALNAAQNRRSLLPRETPRYLSEQNPGLIEEGLGSSFKAVEDSLEVFSRMENKLDRMDAESEAMRELEGPLGDPDDPLYDAELADIEARFRRLEQGQD